MPIPAIAQRSGRPPCPCRWRQCCITMPTPRHASAEHRWPLDGGDVIALTLDGIGMGRTARCGAGSACGSTIANANILAGCRPSRCRGDSAARQPWRNLLAHCLAFVPDWQDYPQAATLRQRNWPLLAQAIERGINAPRASSCGRLFDAVACALGLRAGESEL